MKRSILRSIAKYNMRKAGITHPCKHSYITRRGMSEFYTERIPSYFSEHWREYMKGVAK